MAKQLKLERGEHTDRTGIFRRHVSRRCNGMEENSSYDDTCSAGSIDARSNLEKQAAPLINNN